MVEEDVAFLGYIENIGPQTCDSQTLTRFQGITLPRRHHLDARGLGRVTSSLQIIFRSEPSSDLLDHFATIGIVD